MQGTLSRITTHRADPLLSLVRRGLGPAAGLAVLMTLIAVAQPPQQTPSLSDKPPEANRLPDKNDQVEQPDYQAKKQNIGAASAQREKQIAEDTSKLLELATQLKAEIDKTSKDTLSINVIRKAESIEKLAKDFKEKVKLTAGAG